MSRLPDFRRSLGALAALLAGAIFLQAQPAGAAGRVTIMLNWLPGGAHVPLFYAQGTGIYKKAGISVDIRGTRGSREALNALAAGKAQFAIAEAAEIFSKRTDNLRLTAVMAYFGKSPNAILALRRSGIRRLSDLAGRRVAAPRSSLPRLLFPGLRAGAKLDLRKVSWLSLPPAELLPALIGGKADAVASSAMVAFQYRAAAREKGESLTVLPFAEAGVNPYSLVLAAPKTFIQKNAALAKAFVRATAEGVAAALERPGPAFEIFIQANPALIPERAKAEWRVAHSLIYPPEARGAALGVFQKDRVEKTRKSLARIRNLQTVSSSIGVYSNDLLPRLRPRPAKF